MSELSGKLIKEIKMQIVSKIAIAKVIGKVPTELKDVTVIGADGQPKTEKKQMGIKQALMRVTGLATGSKKVNTAFGQSIGYTGQFQAISILTGEIYRGPQIYFPAMLADLLFNSVEKAENGVEFAFDIGVTPCMNAHGYEYTVEHLMEMSEDDPLERLSKRLLANARPLQIANAPTASIETPVETEVKPTVAEEATSKSKSKK